MMKLMGNTDHFARGFILQLTILVYGLILVQLVDTATRVKFSGPIDEWFNNPVADLKIESERNEHMLRPKNAREFEPC